MEDPERTEAFLLDGPHADDQKGLLEKNYRPILIFLAGSQRGMRFQLDREETILGRSRDVDVKVDDMQASRRHVKVSYKNVQHPDQPPICFAEDMQSMNGTEFNGKPLTTQVRLSDADRITIGQTVIGFFLRDEMELRQHQSLYRRATRDPLTGLYNRHQLNDHLEREIAEARRSQAPFSLLILDIDHFKKINDTYGHAVGDLALRHISKILQNESRDCDFVSRWGGEEFAIALPNTDAEGAVLLAERIRIGVESSPLITETHTIKFTISLGGSRLEQADTDDTLFQRADKCLYDAKQGGRNRVVFGKPSSAA